MRRRIKNKHPLKPEPVFESIKVTKLINYVMDSGKKATARKVVYACFDVIKEKTKTDSPLEVFETALKNTMPAMEVRSRRVGGANYSS
jgi:small subunit ribosomal protein S7